jgi:hypothetical protein
MMSMLGQKANAGFDHIASKPPKKNPGELYGIFPLTGNLMISSMSSKE